LTQLRASEIVRWREADVIVSAAASLEVEHIGGDEHGDALMITVAEDGSSS
jgi:hypothetical protein